MDFYLKVVDKTDKFVGFVKDPLMNLSSTPDGVIRQSATSKSDLNTCIDRYQKNLDKLFTIRNESNPLHKLSRKVFSNHYTNYKLGELKVTSVPVSKYL